jgi:hypothetical protein
VLSNFIDHKVRQNVPHVYVSECCHACRVRCYGASGLGAAAPRNVSRSDYREHEAARHS